MQTIKVLIVDDHAFVRLGIRSLLADIDGVEVIGEADDGEKALLLARELQPDLVLIDIKMPGMGGVEASKRLLRILPRVKIIAITAVTEDPFPSHLLKAGVKGYLTKQSSFDQLSDAIRKVMKDEIYIIPEVAQQLALKSLTADPQRGEASPIEQLSERELQVMIMITSGCKVQDIADKLCLSTKTINSYRYRLFDKFGIQNDVELTHIAIRYGLHDESEKVQEGSA